MGDVLLRAFTLKAPPDEPYLPYPPGSDVPVYGWFVNEGDDERLLDASTPDAQDVVPVAADGDVPEWPLDLPAGSTVRMEPGQTSL